MNEIEANVRLDIKYEGSILVSRSFVLKQGKANLGLGIQA